MTSAFKWLALVLIFLNIGYFVWAWSESNNNVAQAKSAELTGSAYLAQAGNKLQLLDELAGQAPSRSVSNSVAPSASGETVALVQATATLSQPLSSVDTESLTAEPYCPSLGPFDKKEEAQAAQSELRGSSIQSNIIERSSESGQKFRVYLPSYSSKALADEALKKLRAKKIDSYILSDEPLKHAISLGVFSSRASAEGLVKKMKASAYLAKIQPVAIVKTVHWLNVSHNSEGEKVDKSLNSLMLKIKDLTRIDSPCKAIALP